MSKTRNIALALVLTVGVTLMTGCTTFDNFKEAFFSERELRQIRSRSVYWSRRQEMTARRAGWK